MTPHAFESTEGLAIIEVRRARSTEQELENAVVVILKLCMTVHTIHPSYSGAVALAIRSVGTNVKPVKEPEQRAMALNYTPFFAGIVIYCRISRF